MTAFFDAVALYSGQLLFETFFLNFTWFTIIRRSLLSNFSEAFCCILWMFTSISQLNLIFLTIFTQWAHLIRLRLFQRLLRVYNDLPVAPMQPTQIFIKCKLDANPSASKGGSCSFSGCQVFPAICR